MNERWTRVSRLLSDPDARASYIRSKIAVLVPSQIKALRLRSNMPRQVDLAREVNMQQSRISMFETPGAANLTLETLSRLAAAFKVGLVVQFVAFSEMLAWENRFSQDSFDVLRLDRDRDFILGRTRRERRKTRRPPTGYKGARYISRSAAAGASATSAQLDLFWVRLISPPSETHRLATQWTEARTSVGRRSSPSRTSEGEKERLYGEQQTRNAPAAAA